MAKQDKTLTHPGIISIGLLIVVLWVGVPWAVVHWIVPESNITHAGQMGDMFGVVNALFSGLAFAGIIVTLIMQRDEMRDQQKSSLKTAELMVSSAKITAQVAKFQAVYQSYLKALEIKNNPDIQKDPGFYEAMGELGKELKQHEEQLDKLTEEMDQSVIDLFDELLATSHRNSTAHGDPQT